MRFRCIAFLPPAALVTGLIFSLTSSIVSGLESTLSISESSDSFEIVLHETECELLERRIEEVASDVRSCEALPGCLRSKNICPDIFREELMREWERLHFAVRRRCTGLPTYVTRAAATCSSSGVDCPTGLCVPPDDDGEGLSRSPSPGVFIF